MKQLSKCCGANVTGKTDGTEPDKLTCVVCGQRCESFPGKPVTRLSGLLAELKGAHQFFVHMSPSYLGRDYKTVRYYLLLPVAYILFMWRSAAAYLRKRD